MMDIERYREYCLALPHVTEELPFNDVTPVYKVGGKIFAFYGTDDFAAGINLKCDPDRAVELRDRWPDDILPGYHMNKKHWNTVRPLGNLPESLLLELTRHSYDLVCRSLPPQVRTELEKRK